MPKGKALPFRKQSIASINMLQHIYDKIISADRVEDENKWIEFLNEEFELLFPKLNISISKKDKEIVN